MDSVIGRVEIAVGQRALPRCIDRQIFRASGRHMSSLIGTDSMNLQLLQCPQAANRPAVGANYASFMGTLLQVI